MTEQRACALVQHTSPDTPSDAARKARLSTACLPSIEAGFASTERWASLENVLVHDTHYGVHTVSGPSVATKYYS